MKRLLLLTILLSNSPLFAQNQVKIDSLKKIISTTKIDTAKVWTLIALGNEIEGPKPNEAYKYYKEAEAISRKTNYPLGVVKAISNFTYILDMQQKLAESKPYYEEAVMVSKKQKLGQLMEAKMMLNLGTWYYRNGELSKTIECYTTAYKLAEVSGNNPFGMDIKANLATIYNTLKRYEESIKICDEVIPHVQNKPDKLFTYLQILHTKASALLSLSKWKEAEPIFEKALKIAEKAQNKGLMCSILNNLAINYRRNNKTEESFETSKRCLAISKEVNDVSGIRSSYHNMGNIYFFKDRQDSAKKYFELSLKVAVENNIKEEINENYSTMSNWYLRQGDLKKYQYYAEKADSLENSIQGDKVQTTAKELEVKYETEKKQNEILQKNIELQKSKSNNQLLGFGLAFLALLGGLGFYSFRKKQQTQLLEKELQTQKVERQRIASEMHDELGGNLTSLMYVAHHLQIQYSDNQEVMKISNTSSEISDSINEIVWSLNQEQNSLSDWVMYVRGRTAEMLENAGINYQFIISEIPEKQLKNQEKRNLYLVIKEAINNAIKHANATKIEVLMDFEKDISIKIHDNGKGFVENGSPKVGSGNGLKNMQKRMAEIDGKIEWKNSDGTAVELRLRSAT